jgi:serine/threonine-protein kinase
MIAQGTVLGGKYIVERVLGEGGMGVVVAAKHAQLGHRVAIKMMLGEALRSPDALARFEREARAAAELSSEHVARVTDVGHFDDGMPYMVMEYLEGEDLAQRVQRTGPQPVGDVIRMFIQACIGLGDAHERGIVHRDIKPSNLFLSARRGGRSTLKVLDFGIAKANLAISDHQLTRTSSLMGSPQYMSPEQLRDTKNVDARTDMWSLGASMYEALTGVPAFPAETLAELHVKILMDQPVPTFHHRPEVPLDLDSIVMRCLAKQVEQRFRSMQQLQDVLEQAERALALPRVAFQSNPALLETAIPNTAEELAFGTTGQVRRYVGELVQSTPNAALPSAAFGGSRSIPPQAAAASAKHFVPTFAATDSPNSQTMGGFAPSSPVRKKAVIALAAAALFAGAFFVTKIVANPASTPRPASAPPQAAVVAPVVPAVQPVAPAVPAPSPVVAPEAAAPSATHEVSPSVASPSAPAPLRGAKKGAKAAPAALKAAPVPAPAEVPAAPKPKKKSALDVDLD